MASPDAGAWRLIWIEQTGSDINGRQQRNSTFITSHEQICVISKKNQEVFAQF
jgi:hypothetical protein